MYLKSRSDYEAVFAEVHRVLKPGGRFWVWDANISRPVETERDSYLLFLRVRLGDREIETGYAQPWPDEAHDPAFYVALAKKAGFQLVDEKQDGRLFFLELERPR
jgi:ubiquinone/menaquinone biosynthesis C-methylase UbiE